MFVAGSQDSYKWLVTDEDFDLLELCPEIVLGKYVAVTSNDSGHLGLTDKETAAGWRSQAGVAYSPKIENAEDVPRDGWDEWYIFNSITDLGTSHITENIFEVPHELGHLSVLVNYGFALHPPERAKLADIFWQQMARIRPESYVADNDHLTFVTINADFFSRVRDAIEALG